MGLCLTHNSHANKVILRQFLFTASGFHLIRYNFFKPLSFYRGIVANRTAELNTQHRADEASEPPERS